MDKVSHLAFSDESYTDARYRSIASVTLPIDIYGEVTAALTNIIIRSGLIEFKWNKLRQARERLAAIQLIDVIMELVSEKKLRIDVLIWDIEDSRHKVKGRDDCANLQRMHYHLFRDIFLKRWPTGSCWAIHPDENSEMNWDSMVECLDYAGFEFNSQTVFNESGTFMDLFKYLFRVHDISEVSSEKQPLCQIADLFAGMAAFSYSSFKSYNRWHYLKAGQIVIRSIDGAMAIVENKFANSEEERFVVIEYFDRLCKKYKMQVGLITTKGFRSYNQTKPFNFWFYEPQQQDDKAPVRDH